MKSNDKQEEIRLANLDRRMRAASKLGDKMEEHIMDIWRNHADLVWINNGKDDFEWYQNYLEKILPNCSEKDYEILHVVAFLMKDLGLGVKQFRSALESDKNDYFAFDYYLYQSGVGFGNIIENAIQYVTENYPRYKRLWLDIEKNAIRENSQERFQDRLKKKEKHPVNLRPSRLYGEETCVPKKKKVASKKPIIRVNVRKMF